MGTKVISTKNASLTLELENGVVRGLFHSQRTANLVNQAGNFGRICYTYISDDITTIPYEELTGYKDRLCEYDICDGMKYSDSKNKIETEYELKDDSLIIKSKTDNDQISQFGIQLDFNFMSTKGTAFLDQYLPTTFFTSDDNRYTYCIMISPQGKCIVVIAQTYCDGWKLDYSPFCGGHFIMGMKFLASFDKQFGGSGRKKISVRIKCAEDINEAFEIVHNEYQMPMLSNKLSGGFDGYGVVSLRGSADCYKMLAPSGKTTIIPVTDVIHMEEYGIHTIIPQKNGEDGMGTTLYNGGDIKELFTKNCDAAENIPARGLTEGGCHLWSMLSYMEKFHSDRYKQHLKQQLSIIMGEKELIERTSIVPYATDTHAAYHLYHSDRMQDQFFGVSILLEAYRCFGEEKYLEFAANTLDEALDNHFENGKIVARGYYKNSDYTTVCAPVIAIVDMAIEMAGKNDPRGCRYADAAVQVAEHLCRRGLNFPTEGASIPDSVEDEREDGSISCTALSLLYVYYHIKQEKRYLDFAGKLLKMHNAWTIYTPDARQYQSSFRFWETAWEGDRLGPAICAGHAWTIWRAEALYYYGVICDDKKALLDSYNGFISNFCKIQSNGITYSCYEPDYLKGGGWDSLRDALIAADGGVDIAPRFAIGHSYPKHESMRLPHYVWPRALVTWLRNRMSFDTLDYINYQSTQ